MSRSRRKNPVKPHTSSISEKEDKKIWHSRMRARERDRLRSNVMEDGVTTCVRDVSNPYSMSKDGKFHWFNGIHDAYYQQLLRK